MSQFFVYDIATVFENFLSDKKSRIAILIYALNRGSSLPAVAQLGRASDLG